MMRAFPFGIARALAKFALAKFTMAPVALVLLACTTREPQDIPSTENADGSAIVTAQSTSRAPGDSAAAIDRSSAASSGVDYYSARELARVADGLAHGSTTGRVFGKRHALQYVEVRRAASGTPEIHDRWLDVTIVQAGKGSLLTGGQVEGGVLESPGEHRGGTIRGGARRAIGPGDLVIIPARTPHQYEIAAGDSLRYLTVKVLDARDGP
jgi:mannose-6-phosphate isomerase-like protein (cupin superfamily)